MKKIGCVLLMLVSSSMYAGEVIVDGMTFSCPNTCVVTTTPTGFKVTDSGGGTVTLIIE